MARIVYARSGQKLVKKWRCTSGKRKGRLVSSPEGCFKPMDVKKRAQMRRTQRQKSAQISRKSQLTKRTNPITRQVTRLNKMLSDHIEEDRNGRQ